MTGADWGLRDYYAGVEDPNVSYTIILVAGEALPLAVVRQTGAVEEAFTHNLRWEPSDLLSRVPAEPRWTARPANVGYANGFLVELVQVIRARQHLSEFTDYKYFAVFRATLDVLDLSLAYMLVRRPEFYGDEEYAGHNMWESCDKLHDIDRGEDMRQEYVAISAAEAGELKQRIDATWENDILRHYVATINGNPFSVAGVPRKENSSVGPIMFTADGEFVPGDLLSQIADEPNAGAEEVTLDHAIAVMAALVRFHRDQKKAELTGGYAMFQHPNDVLDLDSAYGLTRSPDPDAPVVLPLSDFEAYRLFLRLTVRSARRQARPVDGHYYFAVLDSLRDAAEPDKAFSLIRCAADTSPRWEMFLREGEWVPTASPLTLVTLPIDAAQVQRIKARLVTGTRYFQVVNGEPGFMVLIRHTATTEETRQHPDAPWQPCDVLGRWRTEPTWTITQPPWLAARENA
ncbi:hypothetical protein [Lentzea kentuckyensis]|uniref:hypothetical protein n=1 Tax=Lentzea kentuckyensis TaxID=360086 RepID=UPI000A35E21F|nr:hypothetical protein [Lentzea kentuckyensis]